MKDHRSALGSESALRDTSTQSGRRGDGTAVSSRLETVTTELHSKAGAGKLGLSCEDLGEILADIRAQYLTADASLEETIEFYNSLRIEELALARACARGNESAWEIFLTRYREKLYTAAGAIAKEDATARELADSLYAELFGTHTRGGKRVSKLNYYAGRGSLEGWLRTVLAQEFVNRRRTERRWVSLEEQQEDGVQFAAPNADLAVNGATPSDPRLEAATDEVLTSLPAEDRYILSCYYLDGRRLAEIARTLGVHEATISRRVEKITESLSKAIVKALMRRGLSRRQAEEVLEIDVRDFSFDVRRRLVQKGARNDP